MKKLTDNTANKIKELIGVENMLTDEPMKLHTSMQVGGPAAYYLKPKSVEELASLIKILNEEEYPFYIKGNGSNIIFKDEGCKMAIIETRKMQKVVVENDEVVSEAGILLKDLSDIILEASLTGFEFASGIPGSLGGAVCMNAGAYDGEMKNIIKEVTLLDKNGKLITKTCDEMDFSYRHSICSNGDYIAVSARLKLAHGDYETIKSKIDDLTKKREEKQPLEYPSCGSTFKRPEGYFAGKLITDAGMKGYKLGGAQVSDKHAGFVINKDNATAKDILDLIKLVQEKVYEHDGVKLECEVKII